MAKAAIQGLFGLLFFALCWTALAQLPWVKWLKVQEFSEKKEKQLTAFILESYLEQKHPIDRDSIPEMIDGIRLQLCTAGNIDTGTIHLHIVHDDVINAYTLPGGHIIVNDALILFCSEPDMLAGVLGHEMGHVLHGHIKSKMARDLGIEAAAGMAGNGSSAAREVLKKIVSTRFDREKEAEADTTAVRLLLAADIDPEPMAAFFARIEEKLGNTPGWLQWVSTHPESKERAVEIRSLRPAGRSFKPCMDKAVWTHLQEKLRQ